MTVGPVEVTIGSASLTKLLSECLQRYKVAAPPPPGTVDRLIDVSVRAVTVGTPGVPGGFRTGAASVEVARSKLYELCPSKLVRPDVNPIRGAFS